MPSDTIKEHLKTILLTDSEPFKEYWNMWGRTELQTIWLEGEIQWPTFEAMVEKFREDIRGTSSKDLFSRMWKRKSGEFTQRAFNVILCGGVHSVMVLDKDDEANPLYIKWYGWTPSYFADFPDDNSDLAIKAVWEGDIARNCTEAEDCTTGVKTKRPLWNSLEASIFVTGGGVVLEIGCNLA